MTQQRGRRGPSWLIIYGGPLAPRRTLSPFHLRPPQKPALSSRTPWLTLSWWRWVRDLEPHTSIPSQTTALWDFKGSSLNLDWPCIFSPAACDVIDQHIRQKFTTPPTKEKENALLTPEAPSIAFPLANPPVAPEPEVKRQYLRYRDISKHWCVHFPSRRKRRKKSSHPDFSCPPSALRNASITVTS